MVWGVALGVSESGKCPALLIITTLGEIRQCLHGNIANMYIYS